MKLKLHSMAAVAAIAMAGASAQAATVYTSDNNLADFTNGVTYATFTNFENGNVPGMTQGSTTNVYTPTTASLNQDYRVFNWSGPPVDGLPSGNWILATFKTAQSTIRVFPNIDHLGDSYDGFQYSIWGKDSKNNWVQLFDVTGVNGSNEPFTLGSFTGTAPTRVDNILTPGTSGGNPDGTVGYIADFTFGSAYTEFAFGTSTFAGPLNEEQELSAVAAIPEPATWAMMTLGVGMIGFAMRRRRAAAAVAV
jgi:hypothetical protein